MLARHPLQHTIYLTICFIFLSAGLAFAQEEEGVEISWVLTPAGKAGRGLVEVIGDPKTGRWTTPTEDVHKHGAFKIHKSYDPDEHVVVTEVEYTGDNCSPENNQCLALYYFKSTRGAIDLHHYQAMVFDIEVVEAASHDVLLRIGGYPKRSELSIQDQLPAPGAGWKTLRIERSTFEDNSYDDFSFEAVADAFSISTEGTMKYRIKTVRWVSQ